MAFSPFQADIDPPKRRTLDRPRVVAAALSLLEEAGFDGLSMRALAARLGVRAPSLYRHVRDKEELLVHIADAMAATIPDIDRGLPWRERAMAAAAAYRVALLKLRDGARLIAETAPAGANRLRKIEDMLDVFRAAGCSPEVAGRVAYHFNNLIVEFVADETRMTRERPSNLRPEEVEAGIAAHFAALGASGFPNIAALGTAMAIGRDALFAFGLRIFLEGVAAEVARQEA